MKGSWSLYICDAENPRNCAEDGNSEATGDISNIISGDVGRPVGEECMGDITALRRVGISIGVEGLLRMR